MNKIKKQFAATVILIIMNSLVFSQTDNFGNHNLINGQYPKHEIGISYGIAPMTSILYFGGYDDIASDIKYSFRELLLGSVNLQYDLYFSKLHSINFNLTWTAIKHTPPSLYRRYWAYKNDYTHHLCFQIGYSIHFFNTPKVSLYSSIYVGATLFLIGDAAFYADGINHLQEVPNYYPLKNRSATCFNFHINYLGIRIGKKNAANIELGLGTQGIFNLGYRYRF